MDFCQALKQDFQVNATSAWVTGVNLNQEMKMIVLQLWE